MAMKIQVMHFDKDVITKLGSGLRGGLQTDKHKSRHGWGLEIIIHEISTNSRLIFTIFLHL